MYIGTIPATDSRTKEQLFQHVAKWCFNIGLSTDAGMLYEQLMLREKSGNTLIDHNFALPHIEHDTIEKNTVILVKLDKEISWCKQANADIILFIFIRPNATVVNKKKIIQLMRYLADTEVTDLIRVSSQAVNLIETYIKEQ